MWSYVEMAERVGMTVYQLETLDMQNQSMSTGLAPQHNNINKWGKLFKEKRVYLEE